MGANLLSYQMCKRYDTTHHFHLFMYEGYELFICFLLYLYFFLLHFNAEFS